jgi:hypothetical protein
MKSITPCVLGLWGKNPSRSLCFTRKNNSRKKVDPLIPSTQYLVPNTHDLIPYNSLFTILNLHFTIHYP